MVASTWAGSSTPMTRQAHRRRIGLDVGHVGERDVEAALETPARVHALDLNDQSVADDLDSRHLVSSRARRGHRRRAITVAESSSSSTQTTIATCGTTSATGSEPKPTSIVVRARF
jgi:hypothetical protein